MAVVTRIPRRRGSLCGLLLVLLGAWGALGPFVGPYFRFAYTPDKAWAYNSGRLYLSVLPGAAAVLGGLLVLATRSRAAGLLGGLLAAAGGAWFIVGQGIVTVLLKQSSIKAGVPVRRAAAGSVAHWQYLETLGLFTAVGILIVFFGALAVGRFSMISHRDVVDPATYGDDYLDPADTDPLGSMGLLRFNQLVPPFDNVQMRRAVLAATDQAEFMTALAGDPKDWKTCPSFFTCGTPMASNAGSAANSPDRGLVNAAGKMSAR